MPAEPEKKAIAETEVQVTKAEEIPPGVFLPFHNAACWVAYQTFNPQAMTWPRRLDFILDDGTAESEETAEQEVKYWMAYEQLHRAAGRGLIQAYGRISDIYEKGGELQDEKPENLIINGKIRFINPNDFQKIFQDIDDNLFVGDTFYEQVALNWHDLLKVFGPLVLEFGHDLMKDERQPERSSETISLSQQSKSLRGRPPKWDWVQINTEIILLANSINGLPDTQAALEVWVAEKCQELFGAEPGVSTIRSKIAPIYSRLRQKS